MPTPEPKAPICPYCGGECYIIYIECSNGSGWIAAWTCKCKDVIALALDKAMEARMLTVPGGENII